MQCVYQNYMNICICICIDTHGVRRYRSVIYNMDDECLYFTKNGQIGQMK